MTPEAIAQTFNLIRRGHRWAGPCPKCGGSARSDKFVLREDGGFKCYSCDFRGDAITWHREMESLSCPDAHDAVGKPCRRYDCAVWSTCRLGEGEGGRHSRPRVSSPKPSTARKQRTVATRRDAEPAGLWQQWAEQFVGECTRALITNAEQLAWLKGRGVDAAPGDGLEWFLGWHERDARVDRSAIGLDPERNGKTELWLPRGLVIPRFDERGRIYCLTIRRTDEDRRRFLPDLKYYRIEGGQQVPMLIEAVKPMRGVVIVEAELDAFACAAAHPEVAVIALGTARSDLSGHAHQVCSRAPAVLVALDADADSATGQKAVFDWRRTWGHARYWPVPTGKDPGEYARYGNLHTWIEAGLPPRVAVQEQPESIQDEEPHSLPENLGGEGAENVSLPAHHHGFSLAGTEYVIARQRKDVGCLRKHYGCAVFAPGEIDHLRKLPKEAAERVLLAKTIFLGSEVIR